MQPQRLESSGGERLAQFGALMALFQQRFDRDGTSRRCRRPQVVGLG